MIYMGVSIFKTKFRIKINIMEAVSFTSRSKKNSDHCAVKNCVSSGINNLELRFHRFPKPNERIVNITNAFDKQEHVDRLKAWKIALKINLKKNTSNLKVCSLHFKKSDYILPDIESKRKHLKKTAVPFLKNKNEEKNLLRLERKLKRNKIKIESSISTIDEHITATLESNAEEKHDGLHINDENKLDSENNIQKFYCESDTNNLNMINENSENVEQVDILSFVKKSACIPLFKDFAVQVNATEIKRPSFSDNLTTDSELSTATGIESFQVLDSIIKIVIQVKGDVDKENDSKMSLKERVLMTFVKLKHNLSYSFLAILFKCYTARHCIRIFHETVKILSFCLKPVIMWPSREEIRMNMPKCFKDFEDVRVVLDCTETFIQRPAELCCQILTYSHYKSGQTCKIMTGVSPSGNITFISQCYGGRVTDSTIFKQSDLVQLLEPGDGVMVDRGFLIDEVCEVNRWKCIRPPFLKDKKQFNKEESILTAKIAKARVHVERSNQRIKTFQILGSVMPVALVPLIEDFFIIIGATINMSSPIISDPKFM